jgi:hypothetical protein
VSSQGRSPASGGPEFHLFAGELHELRARLFDREGLQAEKLAALQRAYDGYARFGMTAQASRVAESQPPGSPGA